MFTRYLRSYSGFTSSNADFECKEFGSESDASADFNRNFVNIQNDAIESTIAGVIYDVNRTLKINYDFAFDTVQDHLWLLDSKKHPEFEMQTQALTAARLLFDNIKANEPVDNAAKDFQPLIDYFASLPDKYTSDDKSDKKIRYGAFFNLSKIYYFLDQPDKSEKLIKNDYDTKDGERLIKEANQLKKDMDFQKVDGQHFVIDWK